jgi:hypothetical protein
MAADAARLRGFKANLSARINAATAQYDAVDGLLNPTARQLDDLQAVSDKITEQMERIREFLVQLITDAEDDDEAATWQTELTAAETRANTATGRLATLIGRFTGPPPGMPAPPGAGAAGGAAAAHGGRCKAIDALRPQSLTAEFTPVEFRVWRSHFDAYYTASNFAAAPLAEQRAYFFRCLDGVLERRIRPFCLPATPIYNTPLEKGCMGRLEDEFADVYPVIVRRINFMKCKQTSVRQPWAEFYATLRAHGDEADLPTINPEDLYVMRLIAGTADPLLRDKFFREANPTSEVLLRIAREHERSKNTNKAIDGAEAAANVVETDGPAAANVSAQAAPPPLLPVPNAVLWTNSSRPPWLRSVRRGFAPPVEQRHVRVRAIRRP